MNNTELRQENIQLVSQGKKQFRHIKLLTQCERLLHFLNLLNAFAIFMLAVIGEKQQLIKITILTITALFTAIVVIAKTNMYKKIYQIEYDISLIEDKGE